MKRTYRVEHLIHLSLDVTYFGGWLFGVHHDFTLRPSINHEPNAEFSVP